MRRRLFSLLSPVSLLLYVASCVLWVRTRHVGDRIVWVFHKPPGTPAASEALTVASAGGGLGVWFEREDDVPRPAPAP